MTRPRWTRCLGLAAAAVGVAIGAGLLIAEWRFQAGMDRVDRQLAAGRFDQAGRWLARQSSRWPARGQVEYLLGVCEHAEGRPGAALAAWARVPPDSPDADRALLGRAQVLIGDFGRFADAEPLLERAMQGTGPTAVEARHALFALFFLEGRSDQMRRLIQDAWERLPDRAAELRDHWRTSDVEADLETIQDLVDAAARKAPEDDRVWLAQAYLATLEGRFDEAEERLDACLRRRPNDPPVWRALLNWARAAGRHDVACRTLGQLSADDFSMAEILELRAWFAAGRGDVREQRRALERWIASDPGASEALRDLMGLEMESGRDRQVRELGRRAAAVVQAKARYRELLDREPISSFDELARLAETLGRRFEALGWWTLAVQRRPTDPDARAALERLRRLDASPRPAAGLMLANLFEHQATDGGGLCDDRPLVPPFRYE